jgi:hypothetical protein
MPIIQAKDIKPAEFFRVLFVGKSGSGKSTAAVTFPAKKFMIDLDRRGRSVAGTEDLTIFQPGPRDGWTEISPILDKAINYKEYPFQTTIVSSVTSALKIFTQDSLNFIKSNKDIKDDPEAASGAMKFGTLLIPGLRNYGFRAKCMDNLFTHTILQLPNNIIIEAHMIDTFNDDGAKIGESILAPDKFAQALPGYFDEIWYFETVDVSATVRKHYCWFNGHSIARTTIKQLHDYKGVKGAPILDWTDKNFFEEVTKIIGQST